MKTYEEMTRSVLEKGKKCRARRKKNMLVGASLAAMLCLILSVSLLWNGASKQTSGGQTTTLKEQVSRLRIVYAGNAEQKEMVEGVVTPLDFLVRVRDLRRVRNDAELVEILSEEMAFRENLFRPDDETGVKQDSRCTRWQTEDVLISLFYNGIMYLKVDDYEQVQDMSVSTTEVGRATVSLYSYRDSVRKGVRKGIGINWSLSDTTVDKLEKDPEMKLSNICDTITVQVSFQDGTIETVVIDLTTDDSGQIYVTHQGTTINN